MQSAGIATSDMDGDKVMFSVSQGKYYNLGEIGGTIWDFIRVPRTFDQIIDHLLSQYEVERSVCEEQVGSFLMQLQQEELIRTMDPPA